MRSTCGVLGDEYHCIFEWPISDRFRHILSKLLTFSVGSYVIPWESHVNSCHLRFFVQNFMLILKNRVSFFQVTLRSFFDP